MNMRRRSFLENSIAMAGGVCGLQRGLGLPFAARAAAGVPSEPCPESRYAMLSRVLDREAMQRGWAHTVDPEYHHAPQSAIDAFKDLKFGIRIHQGKPGR